MRKRLTILPLILVLTLIFFPIGSTFANAYDFNVVYLGGFPFTVDIENDGAIVVGVKCDEQNFPFQINKDAQMRKGDIIKSIDNIAVKSVSDIYNIMNNNVKGNAVSISYLRGDKLESAQIYPIKEKCSGKYKLGYELKDKVSGLGTITFIGHNRTYGALGHCIMDDETNVKFSCRTGVIFDCKLVGIEKSRAGAPGRLKGRSVDCLYPKGDVQINDDVGLFGKYNGDLSTLKSATVCKVSEISIGAAQIYTNVSGTSKYYDIEIVKTNRQSSVAQKSMVIKVTDQSLIDMCGGIVQGMSGSPIVQNGKLVGAVTHVFTNNPLMGYGVYAAWMMEKAATVA